MGWKFLWEASQNCKFSGRCISWGSSQREQVLSKYICGGGALIARKNYGKKIIEMKFFLPWRSFRDRPISNRNILFKDVPFGQPLQKLSYV